MKTHKFTLVWLVILALAFTACGSNSSSTSATPSSTSKPVLGNNLVNSVSVATQSGDFHTPLDSTPDLNATNIYFTASGPHGPGVFRVAAAGGAATEVYTGNPFVAPRGIAFSPDGQHLYVADPSAGTGGQIFQLAPGGGSPSPVRGSAGTAPQNLDVVIQSGQSVIYFSGKDPASGQAAVLKLAASGAATPTLVAKGSPLVAPDGVVVTRLGIVYVSDRSASGGGIGKVFKFDGSTVTALVDQVRTGNPAGIALTHDESILLVSALQLHSPSDQVLLVDLRTGQTGSVTRVISENQSAGGLHACPCAKQQASSGWTNSASLTQAMLRNPLQEKTERFAWADKHGGGLGRVYLITL